MDIGLRQLLVELPVDTDKCYLGVVGPSDDTPLMWPHQIYQIMESRVHVGVGQSSVKTDVAIGHTKFCH
jgi:hypothetical protein